MRSIRRQQLLYHRFPIPAMNMTQIRLVSVSEDTETDSNGWLMAQKAVYDLPPGRYEIRSLTRRQSRMTLVVPDA